MQPAWQRLLELARPYARAFADACAAPRLAQECWLQEALAANAATDIGRRLGFAGIGTAADYAERVPVAGYADIEAALATWGAGGRSLCAAPAVLSEWTSGSTRAAKRVPHSAAGLEGFRRALLPWLESLCRHDPEIADGRIYWALSPAGSSAFRECGVSNDAAYFGRAAPLLVALSAVPLGLAEFGEVGRWRRWTATFLAACEDLALVSIWNPSFLQPILDTLEQEAERIVDMLRRPEDDQPPPVLASALSRLQGDGPRHAERLHAATAGGRLNTQVLWPGLRRISCWTHATAARQLSALARRLPGVRIEPKGLLSTEAAVSVPLPEAPDPVAAVMSAFLELRLPDARCVPVWEWREGDVGTILVTTRSGLWRYDTGDRVRITGYWKAAPCLIFLGREGSVVDLCGEKLDEALVLARLPAELEAFQAPAADGRGYCLFLEAAQVTQGESEKLAERVDAALCEILHYGHARELGQLAPLRAVRVRGLLAGIARRRRETRGTPLATLKVPVLDGDSGWLEYFASAELVMSR